jgi:hypothetical protein
MRVIRSVTFEMTGLDDKPRKTGCREKRKTKLTSIISYANCSLEPRFDTWSSGRYSDMVQEKHGYRMVGETERRAAPAAAESMKTPQLLHHCP